MSNELKAIYLDQSVLSHAAGAPGTDWRTTNWGSVVHNAMTAQKGEVWASPTHVLEIALCADFDNQSDVIDNQKLALRRHLAQVLVEMAEARRMMPSRAIRLIQELVMQLKGVAPNSIRTDQYLAANAKLDQQLFLGFLGLLASYNHVGSHDGLAEIIRVKLVTQLIQSRGARDPGAMVNRLIEAVESPKMASYEVAFAGVDAMSIPQIRQEIDTNSATTVPMNNATRQKFQKQKKRIVAAYATDETRRAMVGALFHDYEMLMTFDINKLREHWAAVEQAFGNGEALPMPRELVEANEVACLANSRIHVAAINAIIKAAAENALLGGRILVNVLLGDLEANLSKGLIPTAGLTFDADHAVALLGATIFATTDGRLEVIARQQAAAIEKATHGEWKPTIVNTPEQFARALGL